MQNKFKRVMIKNIWNSWEIIHIDYFQKKGNHRKRLISWSGFRTKVNPYSQAKCYFSSGECTGAQVFKTLWIWLQIPSAIFSELSPLWLLPNYKPKEMARRQKIVLQQRNKMPLLRTGENLIFWKGYKNGRKVGISLSVCLKGDCIQKMKPG